MGGVLKENEEKNNVENIVDIKVNAYFHQSRQQWIG